MALEDIVNKITKRFGKESVSQTIPDVEFLTSGSLSLDLALGGGYAKGRVIEVDGWESSGKTTLALHAVANVQKEGKIAAYIDTEYALNLNYAEALGVQVGGDKWILSQPTNAEEALEIARELAKEKEIGIIVLDSIASFVPKCVLQGEAGDQKMGVLARLLSMWLPTLIPDIQRTGCIVFAINQFREKIGVMYGSPTTTPGGNALKFYCSQKLEITRMGSEKDGDEVYANKIKVTVRKNKVAPPFRTANFYIRFGQGIDLEREILDLAIEFDIVKKAGSWLSYGDTKLGQGVDNVREVLLNNPDLFELIFKQVKEKYEAEQP